MRNFVLTICALTALTAPVPAQAQTTTAFDGSYRGVSRQLEGRTYGRHNSVYGRSTRGCALPDRVPARLRIVNGVARAGSKEHPMEGSVTTQGELVMHNSKGAKFDGQIDGQGRATGRIMFGCSYLYVWQKQ